MPSNIDFTKFSDQDLEALSNKDYQALSDEGLSMLSGEAAPAPPPSPLAEEAAAMDSARAVTNSTDVAQQVLAESQAMKKMEELGVVPAAPVNPNPMSQQSSTVAEMWREKMGQTLDGNLSLTGALVGGELGAITGARMFPDFTGRGAILGGMVGSASGAVFGEWAEGAIQNKPLYQNIADSLEAGETDIMYSMMGLGVLKGAQVLGKGAASFLFGIKDSKELDDALASADRFAVDIGVFDVTKSNVIRGGKTLFGMFPWVGAPIRVSAERAQARVDDLLDVQLNTLAPNVTLSQLGLDMAEGAKNAHRNFKIVSKDLYQNADGFAEMSGVQVPTAAIRDTALAEIPLYKNLPTHSGGEAFSQRGSGAVESEVETIIRQAAALDDDFISVASLRDLQKRINRVAKNYSSMTEVDKKAIEVLRSSTESAMAAATHADPNVAQLVRDRYELANEYYMRGMTQFSTATAKKITRYDRLMFAGGRLAPGSIEADELARYAVNFQSVDSVRNLQNVVGRENVAAAARLHVEDALSRNISQEGEVTVVNYKGLFSELGGEGSRKVNYDALAEAMMPSGVQLDDITDILRLAEKHGKVPLAHKFVARRVAIGGMSAGIKVLTMGALGAAGGVAGAPISVLGFALARAGASILQNPKFLRGLASVSKGQLGPNARRMQYARLLGYVFDVAPLTEAEKQEAMIEESRARAEEAARGLSAGARAP